MLTGAAENEMNLWASHGRSCAMKFVKAADFEDVHFTAVQHREKIRVCGELLQRSQLGRVYEVVNFKLTKEKKLKARGESGGLGAKQIYLDYSVRGDLAPSSEPVSETFVDNALTIKERMLNVPGVSGILQAADDVSHPMPVSTLNTCTKLHAIISKARTPALIKWCVHGFWDAYQCDPAKGGTVSLRDMQGKAKGELGSGMVDVLCYKLGIKKHALNSYLDTLVGMPPVVKDTIRAVLESHERYRDNVGYPSDSQHDLTWQAGWPRSCETIFELLAHLIYGTEYDEAIVKPAIRARKPAAEILSHEDLNELLKDAEESMTQRNGHPPQPYNPHHPATPPTLTRTTHTTHTSHTTYITSITNPQTHQPTQPINQPTTLHPFGQGGMGGASCWRVEWMGVE